MVMPLLVLALAAQTADWPQWRGPNRDGLAASFRSPGKWPAALSLKWKTAMGPSYASPVASSDRIFVFVRENEQETVLAVDRTSGKIVWRQSYAAPFEKNPYALRMGKGPYSTPLLEQGRLHTLGSGGILSSWNAANGALVWRNNYSTRVNTAKLFTGTAMSPLVALGLLIVHIGDDSGGSVLALDPRTGKEKWKWDGDGPGYASPIVMNVAGDRQIVTLTSQRAIGLSAATGALLWSVPFKDELNENIVTPLAGGGRVILSGVRTGTFALELKPNAPPAKLWHNNDVAMYMSSPVASGDFVYGLNSRRKGQFFCLDVHTGKVLWNSTGRETQNAALVAAGDYLLALTAEGELVVARKSEQQWEQVARYRVSDQPSWAHPVLLGGEIVIKDDGNLSMWMASEGND